MRQFPVLLAIVASATFAVVPHPFSSGKPAVAQDVNENFSALDTAIQNRATKADLSTKAEKGAVDSLRNSNNGKAEASALTGLQSSINTLQTQKAEKSYADSLRDAIKNKAEASAVTKAISDTASKVRSLIPVVDISTKADTSKTNPVSRKVDSLKSSKQNTLTYIPVNKAGDTISGALAANGGGYFGAPGGKAISKDHPLIAHSSGFTNIMAESDSKTAGAGFVAKTTNGAWAFGARDDGLGKVEVGSWMINDQIEARLWGNKTSTNILTPLNVTGATTISGNLAVTGSGRFGASPLSYDLDPLQVSGSMTLQNMTVNPDSLVIQFKGGNAQDAGSMSILAAADGKATQSLNIVNSNGKELFSILNSNGNATFSGSVTAKGGYLPVPDYVFEPGYKLTTLSDVEAYTAEHKHLPEVPSAAEIEKGGLDLAQMNLILLKKVEELTLHAIAQQKEIEAQKARIDNLEARTGR